MAVGDVVLVIEVISPEIDMSTVVPKLELSTSVDILKLRVEAAL